MGPNTPRSHPPVRLRERIASRGYRCRCGTRIRVGTLCLEFEGIPEGLTSLLRDEAFCTTVCVRAYLLEAMAVLEGLASPDLLSDVQSVYSHLQRMLGVAQNGPLADAVLAPSIG